MKNKYYIYIYNKNSNLNILNLYFINCFFRYNKIKICPNRYGKL